MQRVQQQPCTGELSGIDVKVFFVIVLIIVVVVTIVVVSVGIVFLMIIFMWGCMWGI